jgi:tetratricopeptide (TPR) repeat protein
MLKKYAFTLLAIVFISNFGFSQNQIPKHVSLVFNNLVNTYGSVKIPPKLEFSRDNESVIALYVSTPRPTVKIDKKLLSICSSLGKDSLNALSIVLSHELAHYYNDHTFCYDFSFAHKGFSISKSLINISSDSKKEKEIQADYQGLWYALMAGYEAISAFDRTFDNIYKAYNLPKVIPSYPTKIERKELKSTVLLKIEKLAPIFNSGLILSKNLHFNEAKDCFEFLLQTLPTQENFNNAGVAYLSLALSRKIPETIPFKYPIYNDHRSFLIDNVKKNGAKGANDEDETLTQEYIEKARKYFEKAISINPKYFDANLNLAILHSINDNQEAAIGLLNGLEKNLQQSEKVVLIKAIANFKLKNETNAEVLFSRLSESKNQLIIFDKKLYELSKGPKTLLNKFLINQHREELVILEKKTNFELTTKDRTCQSVADLQICNNKNQDQISIEMEKTQLLCKLVQDNWEVLTKPRL